MTFKSSAGVRMRYPTAYVMICENDENTTRLQSVSAVQEGGGPRPQSLNSNLHGNAPLTPPHSPNPHLMSGPGSGGADGGIKINLGNQAGSAFEEGQQMMQPDTNRLLGHQIIERVAQDATLTTGSCTSVKR